MLDLMLGQSPAGTPYSCFKTQEAIVSTLIARHDGIMGIAEHTLNGKFAQARRRMRSLTSQVCTEPIRHAADALVLVRYDLQARMRSPGNCICNGFWQ